MNKVVLLILAGMLAFLAEGCTFFSEFAESRRKLDEVTTKPEPANAIKTETPTEEELFTDLNENQEPLQQIAGLIPATNPDVRARSSARGRNDPFSIVTLSPRIEIEEDKSPRSARSNNSSSGPQREQASQRDSQQTSQQASNNSKNSGSTPSAKIAEANTPFEPVLARDVVVSGLFEANGKVRVIVRAPEEKSSRYVEVGQYLSNGRILVKRIDKDHFPSPVVILEQRGVEVAKAIGEGAESS